MLKSQKSNTLRYATMTLLSLVASFVYMINSAVVYAADLNNRSVVVASSEVSVYTSHRYNFRIDTSIAVGSLEIEYCTNSPFVGTPCTAPVGLSLSSSTLGAQSGLIGFSIAPGSTVNKFILNRAPSGVSPPQAVSITANNVRNPDTPNQSVFVRISTFPLQDLAGPRGDRGTVMFSTARQLTVNGFVPPYLIFCVGNTVAPDCSSAVGSYLDFGELSSTTTKTTTSQFAASTNDVTGYITTVSGLTLTSGNNIISALASPSISTVGSPQFGINLRANSSPLVGSNISGIGSGVPNADFNTPNNFVLKNGTIASSSLPTEFNVYTVSYIANISSNQPPGVYISTLTYVTTVSF